MRTRDCFFFQLGMPTVGKSMILIFKMNNVIVSQMVIKVVAVV